MKKILLLKLVILVVVIGCDNITQKGDNDIPLRMVTHAGMDEDMSGDIRPEARALIEERLLHQHTKSSESISVGPRSVTIPETIRVWRRGLDGSTSSCSGRVDVIPVEKYVKGVLPHEWYQSWHNQSLKSGAVAIRTYAVWWVQHGGKYSCADLDDTTASQVYKDEFVTVTNNAVDATSNMFVVKSNALSFTEYSAEAGDPTADGIADSVCAGYTRKGHGRGLCQWGSQRWAQANKSYTWILSHYYPGSSVITANPETPSETIIIDSNNGNNDTDRGYIEVSSNWISSAYTSGYYGTGYYYALTEAISDTAVFYFYLPESGTKTVDAWWTAGTNRATAAPFVIVNSNGTRLDTVAVDQSTNGSRWNAIGSWYFTAGWNRIMLSRWTSSGDVVIADAVRVR